MNVYEVANEHRAALLRGDQEVLSRLARTYRGVQQDLLTNLSRLLADVSARQSSGEEVSRAWLNRQTRLEELLNQIELRLDAFGRDTVQATTMRQRELVAQAPRDAVEQAVARMGPPPTAAQVSGVFNIYPTEAMDQLVGQTGAGTPLTSLLSRYGEQAANQAKEVLIQSMALGRHPQVTASLLRDQLGESLSKSLTIARTESLRSYRLATQQFYQDHNDVITGWIWLASLGPGSCACCIAMHGTFHQVSDPLDGHPNCRCCQVPQTKTWEELGFKSVDEPPSNFGPTGPEWFAQQPLSVQRGILGDAGSLEYRGGRPLTDWVGQKDNRAWGTMRYQRSLREIKAGPPPAKAVGSFTPLPQKSSSADAVIGEKQPIKGYFDGIFEGDKPTVIVDDKVKTISSQVFGRDMSPEDYAVFIGAPPGATVKVSKGKAHETVSIKVTHPQFSQERSVRLGGEGIIVNNELFEVNEAGQGKGIGTRLFAAQVDGARKYNAKLFVTEAAGNPEMTGVNGYYTWPRLGYRANISERADDLKAAGFDGVETTHDLFSRPGGAQWWKDNGNWLDHAVFDLDPDSVSSQVLSGYLRGKGLISG